MLHLFHKWTKWTKGREIKIIMLDRHGLVMEQRRKCIRCDLLEYRHEPVVLCYIDRRVEFPNGRRAGDGKC